MKPKPTPRVFLCLFLLYAFPSLAQNTVIKAERWYQEGDSLKKEKAFAPAIEKFAKALAVYEESEQWKNVAKTHNALALCNHGLRKFEIGKMEAEKALTILQEKGTSLSEQEGYAHQHIGYYYQAMSKLPVALDHYKKALDIHRNTLPDTSKELAESYIKTAYISAWMGKREQALILLDTAKSICDRNPEDNLKNLAQYYSDIRKIHSISGQPDKVIKDLENELKVLKKFPERNMVMEAKNQIGFASYYSKSHENEKAIKHILEAIRLYKEEQGEENNWMILMYNNASEYYSRLGENDNALHYAQRSLDISKKIFEPDHLRIGSAHTALALVYRNDFNYKKALEHYLLGLENYEKNYGENHWTLVPRYANIGGTYAALSLYDEALPYFEKSIEMGIKLFGEEYENLSSTYEQMGKAQMELGHMDEALSNFKKSVQAKLKKYGEKNFSVCSAYLNMGRCYTKFRYYEEAASYFDKILMIYGDVYQDALTKEFSQHDFDKLNLIMETLQGRAAVARLQYTQTSETQYLENSKEAYKEAVIVAKKIRRRIDKYQDKIDYAKAHKILAKGAVQTHMLLFEATEDQQNLEQIFAFSEQSKSNTLQEMLATNEKRNLGAYTNVAELENSLKSDRALYLSRIEAEIEKNQDSSKQRIAIYKKELFHINAKYDSLLNAIKNEKPGYYIVNNRVSSIQVKEVQLQLPVNTALVDYFIADSTVYISVISKHNFDLKKSNSIGLEDKIDKFNLAVSQRNMADFKSLGYELYRLLLEPIKEEIQEDALIIVPNDVLWNLNFELLLTSQTNSNNPKELPYVLKDYAISYANSARLLLGNNKNNLQNPQECLAFSFSNTEGGEGQNISLRSFRNENQDLPGTREEIRQIAKIVDGQYFYGVDATELNFKKNAKGYAILHLALHGKVDDNNPENSKLFFIDKKGDNQDNKLYVHELFAMDLPAEMAVLSACETGKGKVHTGEGIMSLGNAFQYAGTKSLLLSGWEVSDNVAPKLMGIFYRNLQEGMTKSKALQQAKIEYLESSDETRSDPFYWGSFYLVGNTAPIALSKDNGILYFGIPAALVLLFFVIYRRQKSSKKD